MPHLTEAQWLLAISAAVCVGLSKAGFSGLGLVAVVSFASIFGARDSTGIVLPMLIVADIGAVLVFKQHARWDYIRRTLPLACVGIVIGALVMKHLDNASFKPVIGIVILGLAIMQFVRMRWPNVLGKVPHSRGAAWTLGLTTGVTTMMANAAGPVMALYCVAVDMPKFEIVGTLAWFFFIANLAKVPFSIWVGVIHGSSLALNAVLIPAIVVGLLVGRWLIRRLPQRAFEGMLLALAAFAALRLLLS